MDRETLDSMARLIASVKDATDSYSHLRQEIGDWLEVGARLVEGVTANHAAMSGLLANWEAIKATLDDDLRRYLAERDAGDWWKSGGLEDQD